MIKLNVHADATAPPDVVQLTRDHPEFKKWDGKHVVATTPNRRSYVTIAMKPTGSGGLAAANQSVVGSVKDLETVSVSIQQLSELRWRAQRLWSTGVGQLSVIGFLVAIAAVAIKLALIAPEWLQVTDVSTQTSDNLTFIAELAGPFGTLVTFIAGSLWKA